MERVALSSHGNSSQTEIVVSDTAVENAPVLRLRLKKTKLNKNVNWTADTVDNEDMGKKKSKCCCIYKKPLAFGESSSDDDEECEHCFGHPEKKRRNKKKASQPKDGSQDDPNQRDSADINRFPMSNENHS